MNKETKELLDLKDWNTLRILKNLDEEIQELQDKIRAHINKIKRRKNI